MMDLVEGKGNDSGVPLFRYYPMLEDKLPYVSLGEFPTPVDRLEQLGKELEVGSLYIKRDDLSGRVFGGNKLRKLQFILGEALRERAKWVLSFGCAGSNSALAIAIYAKQVGMKAISMLLPQPNAHYVRSNLLMNAHCGAELHYYPNELLRKMGTIYQLLRHRATYGSFPKVIPFGASSPLGTVGFVDAAFELKEQIEAGEIPAPDLVYVALGTMGTTAGLLLGLKAAKLKTRVVPVRVVGEEIANPGKMRKLLNKTGFLLHSLDPAFPSFEFSSKDFGIRHDCFGQRYALFTESGMKAIRCMKEAEGIELDGTYTGKAFAAVMADAERQELRDKVVLFWDTYNSRTSEVIKSVDYHALPRCFHHYFEEEVQALDCQAYASFSQEN